MKKLAVLFSGQGSQYPMMGKDFYDQYPYLETLYQEASEILGYNLKEVVFEENPLLNNTLYTQPAILVTSLAIYEVLKREYDFNFEMCSGFSLGEYSALCASGIFSFTDIVKLIKYRAMYMEEASQNNPGKMAAVIGMKQDDLLRCCDEISNEKDFVTIANYNCPNQLVVSGTESKIKELKEVALSNGARRYIELNVSGGFHTKLMEEASVKLGHVIDTCTTNQPTMTVMMNTTAEALELDHLKELMQAQIMSPVQFEQSVRNMINAGVEGFIEIGPGSVLSGFVKKVDRSIPVISVDKVSDLDQLKESGV